MKSVAIAVAILFLAALLVLPLITMRALAEQSARMSGRMAGLAADFDVLAQRVERISEALSQEIASSRRGSREDMQSVQGRLLLSLSSIERRLGLVSAEQDRLGEKVSDAIRSAVALADRPADAASVSAVEPAAPRPPEAAPPEPAPVRPELDLRLQRSMDEATALFRAGRFAEARALFADARDRQPENTRARLWHAVSLYHENPGDSTSYPRIEAELETFCRALSPEPEALRVMGLVAMERMRWADALGRFRVLIAAAPGNPGDLKAAALCCLRLDDSPGAQRLLDEASLLDPSDAETWYYAGLASLQAGDVEGALSRFERCLTVDPGFQGARVRAGLALLELHRFHEALEALEPARRTTEVAAAIGDCHQWLGDAAAARAAWVEAIAMAAGNSGRDRPPVAEIYARLARSTWESGEYTDCIAYCNDGARRGPAPVLQAYLGAAYMALGERDKGRRLLLETAAAYTDAEAGALAASLLASAEEGRRP